MNRIIITCIMIMLLGWTAHRTEINVGRVLNENGDGKLYNGESYYNYIAYPDEYHTDDIILTIDVLNPANNYCDDIIFRYDLRLFQNIV